MTSLETKAHSVAANLGIPRATQGGGNRFFGLFGLAPKARPRKVIDDQAAVALFFCLKP